MNYTQLSDINNFFYSGLQDQESETQSEVMAILMQPKRSQFYSRSTGAGIPEYENQPITAMMRIMMAYDVVMAFAQRNARVSVDKTIAVSQNSVTVEQEGDEVKVSVLYIPIKTLQAQRTPGVSIGGSIR